MLLHPCDTRWSSLLFAADRLLRLRPFVEIVLPQPPLFWAELADLQHFLKAFQVATDVMQSDCSTLYDVYEQFIMLLSHVRALKQDSAIYAAKDGMLNVILDMWERHVNYDAVAICAVLSFSPDAAVVFKDKMVTAHRWFFDFAAEYAVYWKTSEAASRSAAAETALLEWSDFNGRAGCFDRVDEEVRMLRASHSTRGSQFDPRTVWRLHLLEAPVISQAAIALLSVAGSEAAVERTFSAQGLVHSSRRNRLADEAVEAEMFIKFNHRVVAASEERARSGKQLQQQRKKPHQGHCVEMDEGYDGDTEMPNIADAFQRPVSEVMEEAAAAAAEENAVMAEERAEQQEEEQQVEAAQPGSISAVLPALPADDVQAFIKHYVKRHGVNASWRWNQDRMNQLMVEAQGGHAEGQGWTGAEMRDTDMVLKDKIMQLVRGEEQQPEVNAGVVQ